MKPSTLKSSAGWLALLVMLALSSSGVRFEATSQDSVIPPPVAQAGR